jgi:hypothetical protein
MATLPARAFGFERTKRSFLRAVSESRVTVRAGRILDEG